MSNELTPEELDRLESLIPRDIGEILEGNEPDRNSRYFAAFMDPETIRTLVAMARRALQEDESLHRLRLAANGGQEYRTSNDELDS